jgi:phosphoglycolate phosphatase-like HAD superfamily hydrolase
MNRPKTIFLDIDGVLVNHTGDLSQQVNACVLEGTVEKLIEWDKKGYNLILTTGRRESMRELTIKQLQKLNIFYDILIMGIGGGERIIINDKKPNNTSDTCRAINLTRNQGIKDIEL